MADWGKDITDKCIISQACRERFLPLEGPHGQPLVERGVNLSGISHLRAPYEIARRRPGFHLVIVTLEGEGRFRLASGEGLLRPGDLWVVPVGEPQQYGTDGDWRILFFHIDAALPGGKVPFQGPAVIPALFPAQLESAMTWYLSELLINGERSLELAKLYAQTIVICLDRALEAPSRPERSRRRVRLDELWESISGNIGRNWTVGEMARRMSLSVSQLRRVVISEHGCSPQEMLLRMRIGRAQQLLFRTEDTLAVVAERVGYESPFSLSRAFRRLVGLSPRQYRKQALLAGSPAPNPQGEQNVPKSPTKAPRKMARPSRRPSRRPRGR